MTKILKMVLQSLLWMVLFSIPAHADDHPAFPNEPKAGRQLIDFADFEGSEAVVEDPGFHLHEVVPFELDPNTPIAAPWIGLITQVICEAGFNPKDFDLTSLNPANYIGPTTEVTAAINELTNIMSSVCGSVGQVAAAVFNIFSSCCTDDDATVIVTAGYRDGEGGNSLSVKWYGVNPGVVDSNSLGNVDRATTRRWNEDLGDSDTEFIELVGRGSDPLCVRNVAFQIGPSRSGTGRREIIHIDVSMIASIMRKYGWFNEPCLRFDNSYNNIQKLRFHWPIALQCFRNYSFDANTDYADCLQWAVAAWYVNQDNGFITEDETGRLDMNYFDPHLPAAFKYRTIQQRKTSNGLYCLINKEDDLVYLAVCDPGDFRQQWETDSKGRIRNRLSNKCLEAGSDGTLWEQLFVWECNNAQHQQWTFYSNGRILNRGHGKAIGVGSGCASGANNENSVVELQTRTDSSDNCGKAQAWDLLRPRFGPIFNLNFKCMELVDGNVSNLNPVRMEDCNGGSKQDWWFDLTGRIRSRIDPNKCVEAGGDLGGEWSQLFIYECSDGEWQQWTLRKGRFSNKYHTEMCIGASGCASPYGANNVLELQRTIDGHCGGYQYWIPPRNPLPVYQNHYQQEYLG